MNYNHIKIILKFSMDKTRLYPTKNSHQLLKISFFGHIFNDMYWFIIPLVLPIIKSEFHLNYAQSGLLLTSYTIMGAFGSFITGYLGDRAGRRFILSWGFFLGSLALVLCALSSNYWQLFFALVILGVGISAFHPSMIAVLSNSFTYKRGTVLGLFQFWGWIGTLSVVIVVSLLIRVLSSWREILLILSIPGFIFAPLFFKFLKPLLKESSLKSKEKKEDKPDPPLSQKKIVSLPFIIFVMATTLFTITYYAVINFIPTYLVEERSFNVTFASYSFIVVVAGGLFGTIASGRASDELSSLGALIAFVAFGGPVIILLTLSQNYIWLIVFLILLGISHSGVYAPQQTHLAEITPQKSRGGIYGVIFCLSYIVGAIAPGVTGLTADYLGLSNALRLSTFPLFISLILLFILKKLRYRRLNS